MFDLFDLTAYMLFEFIVLCFIFAILWRVKK